MNENYLKVRLTIGVLATIGLYSVLYRENKFYRFFEHVFLGLAAGFMIVALWTETLKEKRSGVVVTRAVPVTLTVSTVAGSRGGIDCANALAESAAANAASKTRFMANPPKTSSARYNARLQICDAFAARGVSRR